MPSVEVVDRASTALYGRAMGFVLPRKLGPYLVAAHDPWLAHGRVASIRNRRDPFQDSGEPLRLALATDTRWLPSDRYRQLLLLARLPGVEIHLVPGLSSMGEKVCDVRPNSALPETSVTVSCRPRSWTAIDMGARSRLQLADTMYPEFGIRARRLVLDVMLHEATGSHFIVSDLLASSRNRKSGWWLREAGVCSVSEAFRLAGTKARMYADSTVRWDHWGTTSMNVGLWQDRALLNFAPPLRRALAGALNPDAPEWEAKASNHLLAVRAGLRDILIARDAVYRLIRSDGLPLERRPTFASEQDQPNAGARGNDLVQLLGYHAVAALNLAYSVSDNLVLVLRWKTGMAEAGRRSRGFTQELIQPRKPLRRIASQLLAEDSCARLVALRAVRNRWIHEDFVLHGRVQFHPPGMHLPEMSVIWLQRDDYRAEQWATLSRMSTITMDDAAIVTFDGLLDQLWASTVETLETVLGLVDWSNDRWLLNDEAWRDYRQSYVGWDRQLLRGFWGLHRGRDMSTKSRNYITA